MKERTVVSEIRNKGIWIACEYKKIRESFPEEVKLMVRYSGWKGVGVVKEVKNIQVNTCKGRKRKGRKTNGIGGREQRGEW